MKKVRILLVAVVLGSCASTTTLDFVKLDRGNILYKTEEDRNATGGREHDVILYESKPGAKVKLELTEGDLKIKPQNLKEDFKELGRIKTRTDLHGDTGKEIKLLDAYTYPKSLALGEKGTKVDLVTMIQMQVAGKKAPLDIAALDFQSIMEKKKMNEDADFKQSVPLRFNRNKPVFQTLTIPFKIRGRVGDVPSTVATNFNAGIAYGYQWNLISTYPIYGEAEKMVGYEQKQFSFSAAPFAGLTTMALSAKNTDPDIVTDQTVMGYSIGVAGVLTFNRLNFGLALGIDHGFGNANDWIYQDKIWTGIVIGLDLIK